jgi:hypothetical protein
MAILPEPPQVWVHQPPVPGGLADGGRVGAISAELANLCTVMQEANAADHHARLGDLGRRRFAAQENGSVRVDIRGGHLELATWAAARGLVPCGSATLMVHGGNLPGERDKLFAPVSGATG